MKKLLMVIALLIFGALSVACSSEEAKTVDWYMAPENKQALHEKIAECRNNPGKLQNTPNCINAQKAADRIVLGGKLSKGEVQPSVTF